MWRCGGPSAVLGEMGLLWVRENTRLSWWVGDKESACQAGDVGLIPGSRRSPEEGNGRSDQISC